MRARYLFLTFSLLVCVSCVDIQVHTTIKSNGSGLQKWMFTTTAILSSQIKKQVEKDPFFSKGNVKISDEFKEGDYILTAEIPFRDVKELENEDRQVQLEKTGILTRTYKYTETWKRSSGQLSMLANQARGFVPVTVQITVEMPGRIIDSNADHVEGGIAKWQFPVTDLSGSKTLKVQSKRWNPLVVIPFLAFAFTTVVVAGVLIHSKRRNKTGAAIRCSSCAATVSAGSAFCNSCGAKLE